MSLQAWQLEAQAKFKEFKRSHKLIGEQVDMNYTVRSYEEHWDLNDIQAPEGIAPARYRLFAGRFFCKVEGPAKQIFDLNEHSVKEKVVDQKEKALIFPEFPPKQPERIQIARSKELIYTVEDCGRCGLTHDVKFKSFTNPPKGYYQVVDGKIRAVYLKWFGLCPTNNEPILMALD